MDKRDFFCPLQVSGETTVKGTGLQKTPGKEDPVELDFIYNCIMVCRV